MLIKNQKKEYANKVQFKIKQSYDVLTYSAYKWLFTSKNR